MHEHTTQHLQDTDIIRRWKQSNLSQVQFCKQEGISYFKFQYQCRKLRKQNSGQQKAKSDFLQLKIKEPMHTAAAMEIHFPGGQRLFFHQTVEAAYIKNLLS